MNERIKELAEQADIYINKYNCAESGNGTEIIGWHIEKFAELIVKECIDKIQSNRKIYNPSEWDQGADWGLNDSINTIKEHFGVE